jgi:alpha-beta hydrolase superfamily lysophospholipase
MAASYAPDLRLVAVATAAPAAELRQLLALQWNQAAAWVIGADVVSTWPTRYPELNRNAILTPNGQQHWQDVASKCIVAAALTSIVRQDILGQNFFAMDPWQSPPWRQRFQANTPQPIPTDVPLLVAQSTTDAVVLPRTTATLVRDWCRAGDHISTLWVNGVSHQSTAIVVGPSVVQWIDGRLRGDPAADDCPLPSPVAPING